MNANSPLLDHTHAPELRSWVPGAHGHASFPIQNLPLCVFSTSQRAPRGGVAIGDHLLDLQALSESTLLSGAARDLVRLVAGPDLGVFFALPPAERRRFRQAVSSVLAADASAASAQAEALLVPQARVDFHLPTRVGAYTDFFAGIHHALNAGRVFRPDAPLFPHYKYVPVAYNGRASSVRVSGQPVIRPLGQTVAPGATTPTFGPSQGLDFELELAMWVGPGNELGHPISIAQAGDCIAGYGLLNDWSARDIQAWEGMPLGPFLGKSFLTSVSPFVVTADALAPFRTAQPARAAQDPLPLPHLWGAADQAGGALDIHLEVALSSQLMRERQLAPLCIGRTRALDLYWTPAQMVTHHTSNGCDLRPGDLLGSGTISSPGEGGHGSLLELTLGGKRPFTLPSGETRTFLEDGDEVIFTGYCQAPGRARIGFGQTTGTVVANPAAAAATRL